MMDMASLVLQTGDNTDTVRRNADKESVVMCSIVLIASPSLSLESLSDSAL